MSGYLFLTFWLFFCYRRTVARLHLTFGGLAFGRGNAKARTGDKLSNSRKTFRENTPRLTQTACCRLAFVLRYNSFETLLYQIESCQRRQNIQKLIMVVSVLK